MNEHGPKVSVVVPVHNTAGYLRSCVASLVGQTLSDIEIILVENGSTDESPQVCRELATSDSRIRYISISKSDLSSARNAGVAVARGEYIGFVDSDDTVLPEMFGEMYRMAVGEGLMLVNCNFMKHYDGGKIKYCYNQDATRAVLSGKEAATLVLKGKLPVTAWTNLYHRSLFDVLQFPENMYFEDRASTFRFMAESDMVGVIHKAMYVYYQRGQSIVHSRNSMRKLCDYVTTDRLRLEFINNSGMYAIPSEKADVAFKTANHLVRKLTYMIFYAKTTEEKRQARQCVDVLRLIPPGTRLTFKHRLFLAILTLWRKS